MNKSTTELNDEKITLDGDEYFIISKLVEGRYISFKVAGNVLKSFFENKITL